MGTPAETRVPLLRLAVNLAYGLAGEEKGHGIAPQRDQHLGFDKLNLAQQPGMASGNLRWQGVPVAGGTALDDISYINLVTVQIDGIQ